MTCRLLRAAGCAAGCMPSAACWCFWLPAAGTNRGGSWQQPGARSTSTRPSAYSQQRSQQRLAARSCCRPSARRRRSSSGPLGSSRITVSPAVAGAYLGQRCHSERRRGMTTALANRLGMTTATPRPISHLATATSAPDAAKRSSGFGQTFTWQALRWTAIWSAICLLFVSQNILRFVMRGQRIDWFNGLWGEALYWVPFVIATPLLLATARRWPLGSGAPRANIARHLRVMVVFSIIQVV